MNKLKRLSKKGKIISGIVLTFLIVIGISLILNFSFSAGDVNIFHEYELEDVVKDNIKITDINITEGEDGVTTYTGTVKATSDTTVKYIRITIKDEKEEEIVTLIGYVGVDMKKNDERKIKASTDADLSKIKSIDYEVIN